MKRARGARARIVPSLPMLLLCACTSSLEPSCDTNSGGSSAHAKPLTLSEMCDRACQAPSDSPCAGKAPPSPTCADDCRALVAGKSDECASCLASKTGWEWTTCKCDKCD